MDIAELIPLLIFALIYLFGARRKKQEEAGKGRTKGSGAAQPVDAPQKKLTLQQRLDQALQQMEQRIAADSADRPSDRTAESDVRLGPRPVEGQIDPDEVSNEIGRMSAGALYDRADPYDTARYDADLLIGSGQTGGGLLDGGVVKAPGHSGFGVRLDQSRHGQSRHDRPQRSAFDRDISEEDISEEGITEEGITEEGSQYGFRSLFAEVPNETYHGHGFTGFSEAHGLHWGEVAGEETAEVPEAVIEARKDFGSIADLRRAIIMAAILAPPVSKR